MALSPTSSHGGSTAYDYERGFGGNVNIANGAFQLLTLTTSSGPASWLSLTVPTVPTVVVAGTYAFSFTVAMFSPTVGGSFLVQVQIGADEEIDNVSSGAAGAAAAFGAQVLVVAATLRLPAAAEIKVYASNYDGVAARNFALSDVVVQRLA